MQGCLAPAQIIIPKGSLLDPSDDAAVVGGNVQTSQRIVDVVLKAFESCGASQGCMNNVTFGEENWGYYETVGGGSGAVNDILNVCLIHFIYAGRIASFFCRRALLGTEDLESTLT